MAKLSIVATPIGNIQDITLRALEVLKDSDIILCEDTRSTRNLLDRHGIKSHTLSYHQHSDKRKIDYILSLLKEGKHLSLVSEAGTPGVSDPGGKLIHQAREVLGEQVKIEAIPGPSAVTAALSISGMSADKFSFLGFSPHKKGRKKFIYEIFDYDHTVVVYESKHRILKFLEEMIRAKNTWKKEMEQEIRVDTVICRELTKLHETIYKGELEEIYQEILEKGEGAKKGEFVVIMKIKKNAKS